MATVLVVADLKDSCHATPRGLELARKLGHSVEVVAFTYVSFKRLNLTSDEQTAMKKKMLAMREAAVRARIDKFAKPGQKISVKLVWAKQIDEWVIRRSAKSCAMVVKTGHRTESFSYTSTDWRLLRECSAPVLIVAENKWHRTRPILGALDLASSTKAKQKLNHRIIAEAKVLAEALDCPLEFICAIEVPTLLADMDIIDPLSYVREAREKMAPHIAALAKTHDLSPTVFRSKRGPAAKVIASDAARLRAQVVVIGTVGRGDLKAKLLGNTAESVIQHLRTDLLALKPL